LEKVLKWRPDVKLKPFAPQMQALLEKYLVNKFSEWLEGEMTND